MAGSRSNRSKRKLKNRSRIRQTRMTGVFRRRVKSRRRKRAGR